MAPTGTNLAMTWAEVIAFLSANGVGGSVANGSITNAKLAPMVATTLKGRGAFSGDGEPQDLTPAQVKTSLALVKADVGLGFVDNTSDYNKSISASTQAALDLKQTVDGDLTTIAALSPASGSVIQGTGLAWTAATPAQQKTALAITTADVTGLGSLASKSTIVSADITDLTIATADIADGAVTPIKMATMLANTIMGNNQGGANAPLNLTPANVAAMLPLFTTTLRGLVPIPGAVNGFFLSDNGNWMLPSKAQVGLGSVDNTADTAKPVSTAQQTALNLKVDKTTTITTTYPLLGGASLANNLTLDIGLFNTTQAGAVPPPGSLTGAYLKDNGTWATPPSITDGDKIDITVSGGGAFWQIDANAITTAKIIDGAVTLPKLANLSGQTIMGNSTGGANVVTALSVATVKTMLAFTKTDVGLANVDNTSDLNKPVSTAQQAAIDASVLVGALVSTNSGTSINPLSTDAGKFILLTGAAPISITVNAPGPAGFVVGAEVHYMRDTAQTVTFSPGSGTIWSVDNKVTIRAQNGVVTAKVITSSRWALFGDLI